MRIITVSGSGSGAGKTALTVFLISVYKGYAAIKVSSGGFFARVTDSPEVIEEEGKDTALMKKAGASHVVLVQGPPEDIGETLTMAMNIVGDAPGVIIEGNSPLRVLRPDTAFFVIGDDGGIKPGAEKALGRADVVVVNTDAPSPELMDKIRGVNKLAVITTFDALKTSREKLL